MDTVKLLAKPVRPDASCLLDVIASQVYTKMCLNRNEVFRHVADIKTIKDSLRNLADLGGLFYFLSLDTGHLVGVVGFQIEDTWYSKTPCLSELFVLCLDPEFHGFGRVALNFLKGMAKAYGCGLMETGAALADNGEEEKEVSNLYTIKGKCNFSYPSFVWVLPN